jgi:hypothetical protein
MNSLRNTPLKITTTPGSQPTAAIALMEMHSKLALRASCICMFCLLLLMAVASLAVGLALGLVIESTLALSSMLLCGVVVASALIEYECMVLPSLRGGLALLPCNMAESISTQECPLPVAAEYLGEVRRRDRVTFVG